MIVHNVEVTIYLLFYIQNVDTKTGQYLVVYNDQSHRKFIDRLKLGQVNHFILDKKNLIPIIIL